MTSRGLLTLAPTKVARVVMSFLGLGANAKFSVERYPRLYLKKIICSFSFHVCYMVDD